MEEKHLLGIHVQMKIQEAEIMVIATDPAVTAMTIVTVIVMI